MMFLLKTWNLFSRRWDGVPMSIYRVPPSHPPDLEKLRVCVENILYLIAI
jgi:hypothetical protein